MQLEHCIFQKVHAQKAVFVEKAGHGFFERRLVVLSGFAVFAGQDQVVDIVEPAKYD